MIQMSWGKSLLSALTMLFLSLCLAAITGWPMAPIVWGAILGIFVHSFFTGLEIAKQIRIREAQDKERKRISDIEAMFGKK